METCCRWSLILLLSIHITLPTVLKAQEVRVSPEVTGYLGHEVTLLCQFIKGPSNSVLAQVQWDMLLSDRKEVPIIISSPTNGVHIFNTALKERVEIVNSANSRHSLIIRDVTMADAGMYTCRITTFPSGSFVGTTTLIVVGQMPLSPAVVGGIVIAVMLLLVIMAATVYLIRMRYKALFNHSGCNACLPSGTHGPVVNVARTAVRDEDVVYSDVKVKSSGSKGDTPVANGKHRETTYADDVTYAEVMKGPSSWIV